MSILAVLPLLWVWICGLLLAVWRLARRLRRISIGRRRLCGLDWLLRVGRLL